MISYESDLRLFIKHTKKAHPSLDLYLKVSVYSQLMESKLVMLTVIHLNQERRHPMKPYFYLTTSSFFSINTDGKVLLI